MPSHQARRDPLPADYQFPTLPISNDVPFPEPVTVTLLEAVVDIRKHTHLFAYNIQLDEWRCACGLAVPEAQVQTVGLSWVPGDGSCPQCHGPSLRGDLCFNCTAGDSEGQYGHGV